MENQFDKQPTEIAGRPVVWLWEVPEQRQEMWDHWDCAQRYAIVTDQEAHGGIIVYGWFHDHDGWKANPWSDRPYVGQLLSLLGLVQYEQKP